MDNFMMCVVCEYAWVIDTDIPVCYTCPSCKAINNIEVPNLPLEVTTHE